MLEWTGLALRILALCSGLICLYLAIFLYETEQGKVQNILEDLWVKIEDLKLAALSRQAAFVRVVASATAAAYQRLFGKRLMSLQSWAVSASYSLASLCLVVGYLVHRHDIIVAKMIHDYEGQPNVFVANTLYRAEYGDYIETWLFTTGIGLLALGTFPLIMRRARWRNIWLAVVASSVVVIACVFFWAEYSGWVQFYSDKALRTHARHTSLLWENLLFAPAQDILSRLDFVLTMLVGFWTGIVVGIISDMMFIIITRRTLQWASELDNFIRMVVLIGSNGLLAVVFTLGPGVLTYHASAALATQERPMDVAPWSIDLLAEGMRQAGYIASLSNAMTGVVALAVVVLASIALVHRLLWPLLERPVYSLQRLGIARRSKLLGTCGIALISTATNLPSWLGSLIGQLL